jgi:hypothetical protein
MKKEVAMAWQTDEPVNKRFNKETGEWETFEVPQMRGTLYAIIPLQLVERQLTHLLGEFKPSWKKQLWRLYPEDVDQLALDLLSFESKKRLAGLVQAKPSRQISSI